MNTSPQKTAILYRMVTSDHMCPFGLKSRDLLNRHGYDVEDKHLKSRDEIDAFKRHCDAFKSNG